MSSWFVVLKMDGDWVSSGKINCLVCLELVELLVVASDTLTEVLVCFAVSIVHVSKVDEVDWAIWIFECE